MIDSKITDILFNNKNVEHYQFIRGALEIRLISRDKLEKKITSLVKIDEFHKTIWINNYGHKYFKSLDELTEFLAEFIEKYIIFRDECAEVFRYLLSKVDYTPRGFDTFNDMHILHFAKGRNKIKQKNWSVAYGVDSNVVYLKSFFHHKGESVVVGNLSDPMIDRYVRHNISNWQK